jgi:hypothetical protein
MWIFITAVFLVTVWLLYRWPKQTIKGLAVILGVVALAIAWLVYTEEKNDERWRAEEAAKAAEVAKVSITAQYDLKNACQPDHPLQVFITNASSKTLVAVAWELEAYVPGHSSDLVEFCRGITDPTLSSSRVMCRPSATLCQNLRGSGWLQRCWTSKPSVRR